MSGVQATARKEVIRTYARAYDDWATEEQQLIAEGKYPEAEGAHQHALWVVRAYKAEIDDPAPPDVDVIDERDGGRNDR